MSSKLTEKEYLKIKAITKKEFSRNQNYKVWVETHQNWIRPKIFEVPSIRVINGYLQHNHQFVILVDISKILLGAKLSIHKPKRKKFSNTILTLKQDDDGDLVLMLEAS